jgi:hypothetical protein
VVQSASGEHDLGFERDVYEIQDKGSNLSVRMVDKIVT